MEWPILISVLIAGVKFVPVFSDLRPAVLWDPYNPLFACDDPIIYAKLNNRIPFVCPYKDLTANPSANGDLIYESAYLLDSSQEEDFENCNATVNLQRLLKCEGTFQNLPLTLKGVKVSQTDIVFTAGKTYYVVGPTFRKKENDTQLIGGSCSNTENDRQYKLRLKIHICTKEEENNGTCRLCESEGCYYSKCGRQCSPWLEISRKQNGSTLSVLKKRVCFNMLLQVNEEEYHTDNTTICLPSIHPKDCGKNCTEWLDISKTKDGSIARVLQRRSCFNSFLQKTTEEYRNENITLCPPSINPKDCGKNCSEWLDISKTQNGSMISIFQKRSCFSSLLQKVEEEYRSEDKILCPPSVNPKDCGRNCSEWLDISRTRNGSMISILQKRSCFNSVLQKVEEEYRSEDKTCPPSVNPKDCGRNYSVWENVASYKKENQCYALQKRFNTDSILGKTTEEYQEIPSGCPVTGESKSDNEGNGNDERMYKLLAIVLPFAGLLVGLIFGVLCYKKIYEKSIASSNVTPTGDMKYDKGKENPVFTNEEKHGV